jgi:hypothetical protein
MNPLTLPITVLLATSIVSLLGLVFCLCHVVREIAQRREVAKAASQRLADWYQRIQDGLTIKNGQDVLGLQNALAPPSGKKVLTYERQVAEIASTMQTQLAELSIPSSCASLHEEWPADAGQLLSGRSRAPTRGHARKSSCLQNLLRGFARTQQSFEHRSFGFRNVD